MGIKLVIYKDVEPELAITLEYVEPNTEPGRARGWHGRCTGCGKTVHYWTEKRAFRAGQEHVDTCGSGS